MNSFALQILPRNMAAACVAGFLLILTACGGSDVTSTDLGPTGFIAADEVSGIEVKLDTSLGEIVIELDDERAPLTVENFLNYVDSGHYDGTIFHRVIPGFVVQGGGFTTDFEQKATLDPVANEADNGLKNLRYTIAMARTNDPQSATAQFFINVADNTVLDHTAPTTAGWGFAVFGEVTSGAEVVDQIESLETGAGGRFVQDVPLQSVTVNSISRVVGN